MHYQALNKKRITLATIDAHTLTPYDAGDLDRQIRYERKVVHLDDIINIPIIITDSFFKKSIFPKRDAQGRIMAGEDGKPIYGECAIVSCLSLHPDSPDLPEKLKDNLIKSFSTESKPIIRQLKSYNEHFMRNNVPKEYRNVSGVVKRVGRCLRIMTSKNALMQPVYEHSDAFKSLEEAGSPITKEDCKFGSTRDAAAIEHEKHDDDLTMLLGDPVDLYNDTTIPLKQRIKYRKQQKRIADEDPTN